MDCDCGIVCGDVCSHVFYARQMRQNRMQKDIAKEILRLHVVANSDSKKDQALKMEVKRGGCYISARCDAGCRKCG